jgi:hypothetical protein
MENCVKNKQYFKFTFSTQINGLLQGDKYVGRSRISNPKGSSMGHLGYFYSIFPRNGRGS